MSVMPALSIATSVPVVSKQPGIRVELEEPATGSTIGVSYLARGITWSKVSSPRPPQYWHRNSSRRKRLKRVKATRFCGRT